MVRRITFTEILDDLVNRQLTDLAMVQFEEHANLLQSDGWDSQHIFIIRVPFNVNRLVLHARSLRRLALYHLNLGPYEAQILSALTSLASLDLSHNILGARGARALSPLTSLTSLNLSYNHIGDEGARSIAPLTTLTALDLSHNNIGPEGSHALASLARLARLDLSNNSIGNDGAHALASLTALTILDLSNNNIGNDGIRAFGALSRLTEFHADHNRISKTGARVLASLVSLRKLRLNDNNIGTDGAGLLSALPQLTELHLSSNGIGTDGARAMASLTSLTELYLSSNSIGTDGAHALASLTDLTKLHLYNNRIGDDGVRALAALTKLKTISLQENPIKSLPTEILQTDDAQAIFSAYRRYADSQIKPLNEAKLLVVGNEAVGKTSLIRYLTLDKPRNLDEPKTVGVAHERIETRKWHPAHDGPSLNVWDFGGQEISRETHKFFLTERSLYLLVLEDRRENDTSVYKWLRTISNRCGDSPIIIAINKCDDSQPKLLLDETGLLRDWPNLVAFVRTSCNRGDFAARSIIRLKSIIQDVLAKDMRLAHIHDMLPEPWRRVKDTVSELARAANVLTHREFTELCETAEGTEKIVDENEQRGLLRLLHDLGVIVAYGLSSDAPAAIRAVRLLDPNWLTEAIYRILTAGKIVLQNGVFRRGQLTELLPPDRYPPHHWEFILSMMQFDNLGLCFPLPGEKDAYLVPEALPKNTPDYDYWPADSLRFRFEYDFLPSGLVPRLIVESHQKVTDDRWRSGAVFAAAGCKILVRGNVDKHILDIQVSGPFAMKRSALNIILEDLKQVHALFPETKPVARVPLPDNPESSALYRQLLELEQSDGPDYMHAPEGARRKYRVGDLLDGVGRDFHAASQHVNKNHRIPQHDVLIVTALKEELDALLAVSGTTWVKHDGQPTYYTCSFGISGLSFVAVRLTKMGGISLARSAAPLIERFVPRCLAMCGVCAGHPDDTDLGDVILADRVFQYDEGKHKQGGFQGDLWVQANTDTWLYEAQETEGAARDRHGYADASLEDARWWFLEKLLTLRNPIKSSALRRFFPDAQRRQILESLEHDELIRFDQEIFTLTDKGRAAIQRHIQYDGTLVTSRPFHVHVGPIASGNAVMADGTIWRNLRGERKTLGVEMEASAIGELARQHQLPFAIAKGVMDHADEYKTDRYKLFAARVSAEVLCHFLLRALRP